ncbi:dehydrodolichyl diphosphate synthase complex subunit nus1-like [Antedon mediterranea]|uniref:dehydrodolichyl diphosphate synthase complex subunit nus1-like n=1 Tax=Antedon mediterranea TaxID=105859 RepID=UPI003AF57B24
MMAFYEHLLLSLIHYLIFIRSFISKSFVLFKKNVSFYIDIPLGLGLVKSHNSRRSVGTWKGMQADATTLTKIPKHVGIVVVENEFSFSDIANMVVWCVGFGVKFVSLYDTKGKLKQNDQAVATEIYEKQEKFFNEDKCQFSFEVGKGYIDSKNNGVSDTGKISIKLLSSTDGRQDVAKISQQLCQAIQDKTKCIEDVNLSQMETLMQARSKWPDPELVIRCGTVHSLLGYLPWQTRLTEIHSLNSHIGVDYDSLFHVMQLYSRCEQRLGK